jgi:hypothetical protein
MSEVKSSSLPGVAGVVPQQNRVGSGGGRPPTMRLISLVPRLFSPIVNPQFSPSASVHFLLDRLTLSPVSALPNIPPFEGLGGKN